MMAAAVMDSAVAKTTPASVCRLSHANIFMETILHVYIWLRLLPTTTESHSMDHAGFFGSEMPDFRSDLQQVKDPL
jgi:hypothetical protein